MAGFVHMIREVEAALGTPRRILHDAERKKRLGIRRSVYLEAPVKAGDRLKAAKVVFRRPGFGIGPDQYEALLETVFQRDLPAGHRVELGDLA
jgi:sialic acid synthase SpsE